MIRSLVAFMGMKTHHVAALIIRFIGTFLVISGLLGGIGTGVGMYMAKIAASEGTDDSDVYARRAASQQTFSAVVYTAVFIAGCHLILASRRWGRFFARGLDDDHAV